MSSDDKLPIAPRRNRPRSEEELYRIALAMDVRRYPELQAEADEQSRAEKVAAEAERQAITRDARRALASAEAEVSFSGFVGLPLDEALAVPRPPTVWLIGGLQAEGHKATATAQFKAGKTTLSSHVAGKMVDGGPLFEDERFPVRQLDGNLATFDFELTEDDALDMYRELGVRHPEKLFIESLRGQAVSLANDFHAEATVRFLVEHDIEYWVVDPFGRAMRGFGSENDNDDVRRFLDRVDAIVAESRVRGVLMTAHTGRAQHEIGAEHSRGATVLDDDADVRWILTRDGAGNRFFRASGRRQIEVPEFQIVLEGGRLRATGDTRLDVKADAMRLPILTYIANFDRAAGAFCSQNSIKEGVPGDNVQIVTELKRLVAEGTVEARKVPRGNDFWLVGDGAES